MKTCVKCKQDKPLTDFHVGKGCAQGRQPSCKVCVKAYQNALRDADPEKWRRETKRRNVKKYGLSVEEYDRRIALGCAVCHSHHRVGIDHCHATGKLRKPLCTRCNVALGMANDSPVRLRELASYLELCQSES